MKGRSMSFWFWFHFFRQGENPVSPLLADIFGNFILMLVLTVAVFLHLCKKVAGSNSEVALAFKTAATKKALGLIGRLLK
jgi:hypothetical protein